MTEITLEANHCWIDTTPQNLAKDYGDFGIYILGIKNTQGRIIPYYVGQSKFLIAKRIIEHICEIKSPHTTYTIFSNNYLISNTRGTLSDIIKRFPMPYLKYLNTSYGSDILYLNKSEFFSDHKVVGSSVAPIGEEWPLSLLGRFLKTQSLLSAAVNSQQKSFASGSLYFCPITLGLNADFFQNHVIKMSSLLECLETFVKFSLKVNTIGKSQSISRMYEILNSHGISVSLNIPGIPCQALRNEFYPAPQ